MRILTLTSLFPSSTMPSLGIFIETRMKQLKQRFPDVTVDVVAPVPWFPLTHPRFGDYAKYAAVPKKETRNGFTVHHPRYLVIPVVGMYFTPFFMALTLVAFFLSQKIKQRYDIVDGHYYYPDGVAIALVCKMLRIPFTLTARGTDINLIPEYKPAKKMIQYAIRQSDANLAVCQALANEIDHLQPCDPSAVTLRNGVDLELFRYADLQQQHVLREQLNLPLNQPIAVAVGWLVERKGQHLIVEALVQCPELQLYFIGTGEQQSMLEQRVKALGLERRCHFVGSKPQSELRDWFGAADMSILASSREGWANVLLESMACGTPVVATNIWGTPEIVSTFDAGVLIERTVDDIARGIQRLTNEPRKRHKVRQHAEKFSWDDTCNKLYRVFEQTLSNRSSQQTASPN
ncbi:glycosyltransferase [Vibrio ulleungensis]|uniref:Glycosyltransferase n=1 Tax=Vibrio ulleungensis TaxID=2807619 RepID=A0ABS2HMB2_9VIBR|nr:glycosyltransferase [Vibrio ulleungensis]MBM7037017.1 glycosyltransferase [Vibrio ulleungensis]